MAGRFWWGRRSQVASHVVVHNTLGLGAVSPFPLEREAKRAALLSAVESMADLVKAHAPTAEAGRTLTPEIIEALRRSGLLTLKLPRELGGAEADPIVQMDVIEAMALLDPATAWCMFITSAITGSAAARVPDSAIAEMFAGGRFPMMAGSLKPNGTAVKVDGGYRVTGRWSWGSGVRHADYVSALSFADEPATVVSAVVPIANVEIIDNWHVMGMKGTGSCDYVLDAVFVPDRFVSNLARAQQLRGGALYRLGMPGFVVNEHAIFALALARRAINELTSLAVEKARGYGQGTTIAHRAVVQRLISEANLKLHACRLAIDEVVGRLFAAAEVAVPPPELQAEARAMAVFCTDTALDITAAAFRYAGGTAVYLDHVLQQCLRDLYAVQSHFVVHDSAYEQHGQILLGLSNQSSMQ